MNNDRRKRIRKITTTLEQVKDDLSDLHGEEQDACESIPESLQGTDKYTESEEAVESLGSALSDIESAITELENIN